MTGNPEATHLGRIGIGKRLGARQTVDSSMTGNPETAPLLNPLHSSIS
jgi:hypothetical protein